MDHFYKQILDESPVGYSYHRMIYDEEGTPSDYEFIEINRAFEEYTGLKREDVIGRRIREIMPKIVYDEFDWIGYYGDIALNGGKSEFEQFEETLGRYYRVNVFSPGKDHFVTLFTDISKEKKDLIENVTLITALNDAIFTLDTNLKFQQILVPDDSYFLFLKEEAEGKNIWEVFPQDFNDVIIRKCLEAEMTGQKVWAEYQFPFDDEGRWFRAEFKAIVVDRKGRYVINLCDVTEQKRYELDLISKERELDHFFSVNPELLSITDLEGNFLKLNKAWETTLGYRLDFLQGKNYLEWIHKEDAEAISQSYSQLQDKNTPFDFVSRYVCADGAYKYLEWRAQLSDDRIYAAARDITDRKRSEEALFLEKEKYEMTLLSIGDGVISIDADKKIRFMNTVAEQLTGWSTEEAMGHPFEEVFPIINQNTRNKVENPAWEVLKTGNIIGLANHTLLIRRDGTEIAIEDSAAPIRDKDGWIEGVVLVFRDVTDRIKAREKIEYLSQHDFLTGLYNRMYFEKQLRETDREENLPISLIVIDVNGLKLTNDAFGHDKGDQLLKAIAEIIRDDIREQDICARIGGDEFAIIFRRKKCGPGSEKTWKS
jgi:PAS domain S-box-containing protein